MVICVGTLILEDGAMSNKNDEIQYCNVFTSPRGTVHDVYLGESIRSEERHYLDLLRDLATAAEEDMFVFHMANHGGDCHVGFRLANAIINSPARSAALVEGNCYSMGSFLTLACDEIGFFPGTFLMFHNFTSFTGGKGHELLGAVTEWEKHFRTMAATLCSPFLTKKELVNLHADKDVYVHATDSDILARLERHLSKWNKGKKK